MDRDSVAKLAAHLVFTLLLKLMPNKFVYER